MIEEVQPRMPTTAEAQKLVLRSGVPVLSVQRVNHSVMSADRYRLVYELAEDREARRRGVPEPPVTRSWRPPSKRL
jgi:hypothetical protein